jgi:HD-GYP domain-containing protein (c-di-GMP phosphodiesterase class II)
VLILPLEEARPGMKLAAPVLHPDNPAQPLLRSGYALEGAIIRRMADMGIAFIYVEYPELDSLDRHLAIYLSPARQAIYRDIKCSIARVQKQTRPAISYSAYCETTRQVIDTLLTQGQNPIYLDQMSRQGGDAVAHAAAVAHLSLLLGLKLENYLISQRTRLPPHRARDVVGLGVAGMLHDLGMGRLPESLWHFSDIDPPEDDSQFDEWQTHVPIGYELIRNDVETTAAAAVYQHHQRFDGTGFPQRTSIDGTSTVMRGDQIHVFARILSCANLYDRLANPRTGRRRSNLEVFQLIERRYGAWCDPQILRVLKAVAPPFPPGCRLRLTDGTMAIVTEVDAARPMQPIVRRLAEDNWTLCGEAVDLASEGAPAIAMSEAA